MVKGNSESLQFLLKKIHYIFALGYFLLFFISGIGKLFSFDSFVQSIFTWIDFPSVAFPLFLVKIFALSIILFEMGLLVDWLFGAKEKAFWKAIIFLGIVTSFFWIIAFFKSPPSCNCFGVIQTYINSLLGSKALIQRNSILIFIGIFLRVTLDRFNGINLEEEVSQC
jgi:hypothetical protein